MKNKMYKTFALCLIVLVSSCLSTEEKKQKAEEEGNALIAIKSKLLKGVGDALKSDGKEGVQSASEGIGEVIKGANNGFDKSFSQAKIMADSAFLNVFEIGRSEKLYSDTSKVKRVTVYLIANKSFEGKVKLKAFDENKTEIGRSTISVKSNADEAAYHNFEFDKRTPILQASYFSITCK